jgi:uncharacterized protein YhaN
MKLMQLDLVAFGPFTQRQLDFRAGTHGLHVVYGPNEAGKSSALRALRALLYGVPERTKDVFRHEAKALRVGGVLCSGDGQELVVYRRKGRKDTLLDASGAPIADAILTRLLGAVDEASFERLFGIDHMGLVQGGQQLLAERGREATALFTSALGGVDVNSVLERLDEGAQRLFKPGGSKPEINKALSELSELELQMRRSSLSSTAWDSARKDADRARKAVERVDGELGVARARRRALERIHRNMPLFAQLAQRRKRLETIADAVLLPEYFAERHREAAASKRAAEQQIEDASAKCTRLREQIAGRHVSAAMLAADQEIAELREQLGAIRKAAHDRPRLAVQLESLAEQARNALATLSPSATLAELEAKRPLLAKRRQVETLRSALETNAAELRSKVSEHDRLHAKLEYEQRTLAALPLAVAPEALQAAVEAARRLGDSDDLIAEQRRRIEQHDASVARELGALGLWSGTVEALVAAPLPPPESIERFAREAQDLSERKQRLAESVVEAQARREQADQLLRTLQLTGAVPQEEDLTTARAARASGWSLVRRSWLDREDVRDAVRAWTMGEELPAAFERAVVQADEVADRLRRETERVQQLAIQKAEHERWSARIAELALQETSLAEDRRRHEDAWSEAWRSTGIVPRTVGEMRAWSERAARLGEAAAARDGLIARDAQLAEARQRQIGRLLAELEALNEDPGHARVQEGLLAPMLDIAERVLKRRSDETRNRREVLRRIEELESDEQEARRMRDASAKNHAQAQDEWQEFLALAALDPALPPTELSEYMELLAKVMKDRDRASELAARIAGIDADAARFAEDVGRLVVRLSPELARLAPDDALDELVRHVEVQKKVHAQLEADRIELRNTEKELEKARSDAGRAEGDLVALCSQAGCADSTGLDAAEQRSRDRREAERNLREITDTLLAGAEGMHLNELEAELRDVDRERLARELEELEARIDGQLQPERDLMLAEANEAERRFREMNGSADAADLALRVEQARARVVALGHDYVRCVLAHRILRGEVERYRAAHRDPILQRAGTYMRELTLGDFESITSEIDEDDQSVLAGVRSNGDLVHVDGMSTGTRDQLYLALRLATLEHFIAGSEPLPLVVDDILIQFDDRRADATLATLADFSRHTQVILFTHHRRDADSAARLGPHGGGVFVHEL